MNIAELVRFWGKTRSSHQAIVFGDRVETWAELDAASDAVARGLAARGVGRGDRVSVMMLNRPELAHVILATVKLGAISVPLNFRLTSSELAPMVVDSSPKIVVVEEQFASLLEHASQKAEFESYAIGGSDLQPYGRLVDPGTVPVVEISPDDPGFICYTSGTTGVQKGALITHRAALRPGISQSLTFGFTSRDRVLCSAPLVYTGSLLSVFIQLAVLNGATMVLLREFDPEIALDTFEREQVTATTTVPVIWERIMALPGFGKSKLAEFTFAGTGGAPVGLGMLEAYRSHGIPLVQCYGLTEASGMASTLETVDAVSRPGFAGLPLVGTEIRIGDPEDQVPAGEVGEILVRGEHTMREYWNKPEITRETFINGWLRTGDLGLQDEEGFLKVVDRSKDLLISGGLNVYPAEIERALGGIDGMSDLAVIGVKDEKWGEVPMVIYHGDRPADQVVAEIASVAGDNLARFKHPRHVVAYGEPLPRTFSGKLSKPVLRQRFPQVPDDAVAVARPGADDAIKPKV